MTNKKWHYKLDVSSSDLNNYSHQLLGYEDFLNRTERYKDDYVLSRKERVEESLENIKFLRDCIEDKF